MRQTYMGDFTVSTVVAGRLSGLTVTLKHTTRSKGGVKGSNVDVEVLFSRGSRQPIKRSREPVGIPS